MGAIIFGSYRILIGLMVKSSVGAFQYIDTTRFVFVFGGWVATFTIEDL